MASFTIYQLLLFSFPPSSLPPFSAPHIFNSSLFFFSFSSPSLPSPLLPILFSILVGVIRACWRFCSDLAMLTVRITLRWLVYVLSCLLVLVVEHVKIFVIWSRNFRVALIRVYKWLISVIERCRDTETWGHWTTKKVKQYYQCRACPRLTGSCSKQWCKHAARKIRTILPHNWFLTSHCQNLSDRIINSWRHGSSQFVHKPVRTNGGEVWTILGGITTRFYHTSNSSITTTEDFPLKSMPPNIYTSVGRANLTKIRDG